MSFITLILLANCMYYNYTLHRDDTYYCNTYAIVYGYHKQYIMVVHSLGINIIILALLRLSRIQWNKPINKTFENRYETFQVFRTVLINQKPALLRTQLFANAK